MAVLLISYGSKLDKNCKTIILSIIESITQYNKHKYFTFNNKTIRNNVNTNKNTNFTFSIVEVIMQ